VIVQESECWNWNKSEEECKVDVLKWKDDESDIEEELEENDVDSSENGSSLVPNESNEEDSPVGGSPSSESNEDELSISNERKVRRAPPWMITLKQVKIYYMNMILML